MCVRLTILRVTNRGAMKKVDDYFVVGIKSSASYMALF